MPTVSLLISLASVATLTLGHQTFWHPSMYGFNATYEDGDPIDNRPQIPLRQRNFPDWWMHGNIHHPPHADAFFELPAGKSATAEIACHKAFTSYWESSDQGDGRKDNLPCYDPRNPDKLPHGAVHAASKDEVKGCALAIAYESDPAKLQPEDFAVFSVAHECVWTEKVDFQVPKRMPACPEPGGCHCAWAWTHIGGGENYMTMFKCKVTDATSTVPVAKPEVPRRCGPDPMLGNPNGTPENCTVGAKQPFYYSQNERNNMLEGPHTPPWYDLLYNFPDGAQDDIFEDSYPNGPHNSC